MLVSEPGGYPEQCVFYIAEGEGYEQMVTQKDISAACGISVSAVSKALSDYPDISEDTKRKVRDVARKMGYQEVKNELNTRREHTYIVGLLITDETEKGSCRNVIQELRKELVKKGYDLVVLSPVGKEGNKAGRPGYLPRARLFGMEGVFLFSGVQEKELYTRESLRNLRELILGEIPVVSVGHYFAACSCVLAAYEKAVRGLIREIYGRGHRRIAFVVKECADNNGVCRDLIRSALRDYQLEIPDHFYRCVGADTAGDACSETMALLKRNRWLGPTCILFSDELLLEGGITAIRQCGLRIPEDICVAAIRIAEEEKYQGCPVLSWRFPPSEIAGAAVEQMFSGMRGPLHKSGRVHIVEGNLCDEN